MEDQQNSKTQKSVIKTGDKNAKNISKLPSTSLDGISFDYTVDALESIAAYCIGNELTPLNKPNEVIAAILLGRELGLSPMISIQNIFPIKGKASQSVHIIIGKLLANNITYEVVKDYVPVYGYFDKQNNAIDVDVVNELVEKGYAQILSSAIANVPEIVKSLDPNKKTIISHIIDRETRVRMKRPMFDPVENKWYYYVKEESYFYSVAKNSGLIKDKSAWEKDPKNQMLVRAVSKCARLIADDLLNNIYETGEMLDGDPKKDYTIDQDGTVYHDVTVSVDSNSAI